MDLQKGILLGAVAGIIWGAAAMAVNTITGVFPFEHSTIYNLMVFLIGGAIIGIVLGSFMAVSLEKLPFKRPLYKAVFLSTLLWLTLRVGGFFLTLNDPNRYHSAFLENIQGFVLAVLLGNIFGLLWEVQQKGDH